MAKEKPIARELIIFHFNDLHGHLLQTPDSGDFARLVSCLRREIQDITRNDQIPSGSAIQGMPVRLILIVAAGDLIHKDAFECADDSGRIVFECVNSAQTLISTIGNQDLGFGSHLLRALCSDQFGQHGEALDPPIASVDTYFASPQDFQVVESEVKIFPPLFNQTQMNAQNLGDKAANPYLRGFLVGAPGNIPLVIIGLSPNDGSIADPDNDIVVSPPSDAIRDALMRLPSMSWGFSRPIVVIVSHLGSEEDKTLAKLIEGIHVIIGGHDHFLGDEPISTSPTIIVQAGCDCQVCGMLSIPLDEQGSLCLENVRWKLLQIANCTEPPNEIIQRIYSPVVTRLRNASVNSISNFNGLLTKSRVRMGDAPLGYLVADAVRAVPDQRADFGFINAGAIRASLDAGPLSEVQVKAAVSKLDKVVCRSISGDSILKWISEHLGRLTNNPTDDGWLLYYSGLHIYSSVSFKLMRTEPNIDPNRKYLVATTDFLLISIKSPYRIEDEALEPTLQPLSEALWTYVRREGFGLKLFPRITKS